eukprot:CAMPEP_0178372628 /NCGR_PEP_ID=MMETSP0689_2-20121128/1451_1 /TAXON_ID=160604 /ORGANISM="Amphidinium massartii, Strain CS-259" /LENGTH=616 /DNA_ID=CAMNT_0019992557 /DNA_START=69 /DNA_END=1919 /DNA_ORIENTATION=+
MAQRGMLKPVFWGPQPTTHQQGQKQRISYREAFWNQLVRLWRIVYWFRNAIMLGIAGAIASCLLVLSIEQWHQHLIPVGEYVLLNPSVYTSFSFILGFILTFRTNQAYNRYWEGATLLEQMMGNWYDGVSALVAFCGNSSAPVEQIIEFQQVLARLLSLINAVILCELAGEELQPEALKYNLLDATGLDKRTLRMIVRAESRPELIFQQIQTLLVTNMGNGVLNVPPPILTRAFQQMGNAMLNFHDATKLRLVPFPAPYIAVAHLLTLAHIILTPIIAVNWTYTMGQAAFISFVQIFIVCSLLTLANGLDNPFDPTQSGLDLEAVHTSFNQRLTNLLQEGPVMRTPTLSRRTSQEVKHFNNDEFTKKSATAGYHNRHTLQEIFRKYNTETSIDSTVPPATPAALSPEGDGSGIANTSPIPADQYGAKPPTSSLGSQGLKRVISKSSNSRPNLNRSHTATLTLPSLASPPASAGVPRVTSVAEESTDSDDSRTFRVVMSPSPVGSSAANKAGGGGMFSPDGSPPALEIPVSTIPVAPAVLVRGPGGAKEGEAPTIIGAGEQQHQDAPAAAAASFHANRALRLQQHRRQQQQTSKQVEELDLEKQVESSSQNSPLTHI